MNVHISSSYPYTILCYLCCGLHYELMTQDHLEEH